MEILFINPNRISPPVAPLAMDYLGEALQRSGTRCRVLDLCLEDPRTPEDLARLLKNSGPRDLKAVLITLRNLDDAYFFSRKSFLPQMEDLVRAVKRTLGKPVILGGSGFSAAPEPILERLGADLGVQGAAENDLVCLLRSLDHAESYPELAGVVWRDQGRVRSNPPGVPHMEEDFYSRRGFVNNREYFLRGGMAGLETRRGCPETCRYCLDPQIKGTRVCRKPLDTLLREIRSLLDQGVNVFHLCDSEFNNLREHAVSVCQAIRDEGLSGKIRWYTYASPAGFDETLAGLMVEAGCAGINFGVDHCVPEILEALGRRHRAEDLERAADACRRTGLRVMFDLLLGGPGETRETLGEAIAACRRFGVHRVGTNVGIRVYPGTPLADQVTRQGPLRQHPDLEGQLEENLDLLDPVFFRSHLLGQGWESFLETLIGGDPRFFLALPSPKNVNYNYNENTVLADALAQGHRGAFWDILYRVQEGLPPLQIPC
jgi:radical SAM superfamily enzyme YgiQ (UPF0313 family)